MSSITRELKGIRVVGLIGDFITPEQPRRIVKASAQRDLIEKFCTDNGVVCKKVFDCTPPSDRIKVEADVLSCMKDVSALVVCSNYGEVFGLSGYFTLDQFDVGSQNHQLYVRFVKPLLDAGKNMFFIDLNGNFIRSLSEASESL